MNAARTIFSLIATVTFVCLATSSALAQQVTQLAAPVVAIGNPNVVPVQGLVDGNEPSEPLYNPSSGLINYYIPFDPQFSGVYGVDTIPGTTDLVGTVQDPAGLRRDGTLTMYLSVGPITTPIDAASARLTLSFEDLDLQGFHDSGSFRETIEIIGRNRTTGLIDDANDNGPANAWVLAGNATQQSITFNDVSNFLYPGSPTYLFFEVRFGSVNATGNNTSEEMTVTLTYDATEPEICRAPLKSFNLNGLPEGAVIENHQDVTVSVSHNNANHPDKAIVFDSNCVGGCSGQDPDLQTPNPTGHPTNTEPLGNLLIIAEDDVDANNDGLVDDPDDEAAGGIITFDFGSLHHVQNIRFVDLEGADSVELVGLDASGATVFTQIVAGLGDSSQQTVSLPANHEITSMTAEFNSSGSLAYYSFCETRGTISGDVVKAIDNSPYQGADIDLVDRNTNSVIDADSSAINGTYSFESVSAGEYRLEASVSDPAYVVLAPTTLDVDLGPNSTGNRFFVDCATGYEWQGSVCVPLVYDIQGSVFRTGTTIPVAGVTVTGSNSIGSDSSAIDGTYEINNVPNGTYSLTASAPTGYVVDQPNPLTNVLVQDADSEDNNFFIRCAPGYIWDAPTGNQCIRVYTISGTATLQGAGPISGVTIQETLSGLGSRSTNVNGAYSFTSVLPGSYELSASKTGYVVVDPANNLRSVEIANSNATNVNFVLDCAPGYGRRTRLVAIPGRPGIGPVSRLSVLTADKASLHAKFDDSIAPSSFRQVVECVPVFTVSGDVVRGNDNSPFQGATLSLTGNGQQTSAADGAYSFSGVFAGSYTLAASVSNPAYVVRAPSSKSVSVGPDSTGNRFIIDCAAGFFWNQANECAPQFTISGDVVRGNDNAPFAGATVVLSSNGSQVTGAAGTFSFGGLFAGDFTLSASVADARYVVRAPDSRNVSVGPDSTGNRFFIDCANGFVWVQGECVETEDSIPVEASDGTFKDYVLVTWDACIGATSYTLYRSDDAGPLGSVLASGLTETTYQDTTAVPDERYYYTIDCDTGVRSNQDEGWRPGDEDECQEDEECIDEPLDTYACASANGFLQQINIATVINRLDVPLNVTVEYRDLLGNSGPETRTERTILPLQKTDVIVSGDAGLGLQPDTYGTVCVSVDTEERGAWEGGVTLYKLKGDGGVLGHETDFVLYYPFRNAQLGEASLPINTFHLGVRDDSTVANWVRITDLFQDGELLKGTINYYDPEGILVHTDYINMNLDDPNPETRGQYVPDGGRFDFSGHEGLNGNEFNGNRIGIARFIPETKSDGTENPYIIALGRYYYNCLAATCTDFYSAFIMPERPATGLGISGGISTKDGEIVVLESSNFDAEVEAAVNLSAFGQAGASAANVNIKLPLLGTRHTIVNQGPDGTGIFADDIIGSGTATSTTGMSSTVSIFYKLDEKGELEYAYGVPFAQPTANMLISQFNSFIENINEIELVNTLSEPITVTLVARDDVNNVIEGTNMEITLAPRETQRITLDLPADTLGSIVAEGDKVGFSLVNFVGRAGEYKIPFRGK